MADLSSERASAAERNLQQAIDEYLEANDWHGILTTWVLIAHMSDYDGAASLSRYPLVMMNGEQPDHTVLGLFAVGNDITRGVGRWVNEDEEEE